MPFVKHFELPLCMTCDCEWPYSLPSLHNIIFDYTLIFLDSLYFILVKTYVGLLINVGKYNFSVSLFLLQISDNQRVDPLGSWMDFVKRPVGNFPGKCRKRKRPLVNPIDGLCVLQFLKMFTFNDDWCIFSFTTANKTNLHNDCQIKFGAWQCFVRLSSTSPAHPVLQALLAHRDPLALLGLKWPRKCFSRSSKRWLKVETTQWSLPWKNSFEINVRSFCAVITWMCFCQRLQRGEQQRWTDKPAPASYLQLSSPWRGWPPTGG